MHADSNSQKDPAIQQMPWSLFWIDSNGVPNDGERAAMGVDICSNGDGGGAADAVLSSWMTMRGMREWL